jgi:hypothetical protein
MNSLAVLCFIGSIICSVLSYDSFQRARLAQKRLQMIGRLRQRGLDELLMVELQDYLDARRREMAQAPQEMAV